MSKGLDGRGLYWNRIREEAEERIQGVVEAAKAKEIIKILETLVEQVDVNNKNAIMKSFAFNPLFYSGDYAEMARQLRLVADGKVEKSVFKDDKAFVKRFQGARARRDAYTMATVFQEMQGNDIVKMLMDTAFADEIGGYVQGFAAMNENMGNTFKGSLQAGGTRAARTLERRSASGGVIDSELADKIILAINEGESEYGNEKYNGYIEQAIDALTAAIKAQEGNPQAQLNLMSDQNTLCEMLDARRGFAQTRYQTEMAWSFKAKLNNKKGQFGRLLRDPDELEASAHMKT